MGEEYHIYGPPGTGKTSRLATKYIPEAVAKHGPDNVIVASFTKAAAREIARKRSRDTGERIPVNPENVGTMHALCFRALGRPELAINRIKDWNHAHPHFPMTGAAGGDPEDAVDEFTGGDGDQLMARINILRARLVPQERWPDELRLFYKKWCGFKEDVRVMDFTDLIETACDELPEYPGNPSVMFLDEAQDFTALEIKLSRLWANSMLFQILVGDEDQCLYRFKGADPKTLIDADIPDDNRIVLKQSWRVPGAVHARAQKLILRVRTRIVKEYRPREAEGKVLELDEPINRPDEIADRAAQYIQQGKSVMILASCSYMLAPLLKVLKERGIPFGNHYRKKRGDWNPIRLDAGKSTAANIIKSFQMRGPDPPYWTVPNLVTWAKNIKVGDNGLIRKRGKAAIKSLTQAVKENRAGLDSARNVAPRILTPPALEAALSGDTNWLLSHLQPAKKRTACRYPLKVVSRFGINALTARPLLTVGTVHSVKGGQADVVFLAPDISQKAEYEANNSQEAVDSLYRLFYVGMTRAKETLVLLPPANAKRRGAVPPYVEM